MGVTISTYCFIQTTPNSNVVRTSHSHIASKRHHALLDYSTRSLQCDADCGNRLVLCFPTWFAARVCAISFVQLVAMCNCASCRVPPVPANQCQPLASIHLASALHSPRQAELLMHRPVVAQVSAACTAALRAILQHQDSASCCVTTTRALLVAWGHGCCHGLWRATKPHQPTGARAAQLASSELRLNLVVVVAREVASLQLLT
jgi:hypothetical protein